MTVVTNALINKARRSFIDSVRIRVKGGAGGVGLPKYGGIGGQGGDVYICGSDCTNTSLASVVKSNPNGFFEAGNGHQSKKIRLVGLKGADKIIKVPIGVTIQDENKQILGEINKPNQSICVAMGGRGGDKFTGNLGYAGQMLTIKMDLKMISDVGFVGFPNAGKSTLLGAVSRAHPRIAAYPFTTLRPFIGHVDFKDDRRITMTDLPGLIEGSHKNIGLGHDFLKHVSRTRLLAFIIDINNIDLGPQYPRKTPLQALSILNSEIELYDDLILTKPSILVISKVDDCLESSETQQRFEEIKQGVEELKETQTLAKFDHIMPLSVHSKFNIEKFKDLARETIDKYAEIEKLERDQFSTFAEIAHLETNRLAKA